MDARGIPTAICPNCGLDYLKIIAKFDPITYEISMYHLDATCANCETLLTAPTPVDIISGSDN